MNKNKQFIFNDIPPVEVEALGWNKGIRDWQAQRYNNTSFRYWMHRLRSVALSSFEWTGLPEEIDPRFIELCLLDWGLGGMFNMSDSGGMDMWAFAQTTPINRLNLYFNPNTVRFIPANGGVGWTRQAYFWLSIVTGQLIMNPPNAIVLYDNLNRVSIIPVLELFARRLSNIDRTVDININAQKTPYIIEVPEESRRDAINLYKMIAGNEPYIIGNKGMLQMEHLQVLSLQAPYVADKLMVDQVKIWNLALTMLGVKNANTEKRERMLTGEAAANDEDILLMRRSRLRTREEFCEKVNKFFGLDISVRYAVASDPEDQKLELASQANAYDDIYGSLKERQELERGNDGNGDESESGDDSDDES
jgi:hypothetical protein